MERKPIGVTSPHRKTQPTKQTPETKKAINDKIEAMARECERMPFGDTSASFAAWMRGQKV